MELQYSIFNSRYKGVILDTLGGFKIETLHMIPAHRVFSFSKNEPSLLSNCKLESCKTRSAHTDYTDYLANSELGRESNWDCKERNMNTNTA